MVFSQELPVPPRASNNKLAAKLFASSTERAQGQPHLMSAPFLAPAAPGDDFLKRTLPQVGESTKNLLQVQIENLQSAALQEINFPKSPKEASIRLTQTLLRKFKGST